LASLVVHVGKEDLAAVAAERAIAAAASGDDERLHGTMRGIYTRVLLHQGRLGAADRIAVVAAERIEARSRLPRSTSRRGGTF
jgi:hypothetical protein